MKASQNLQVTWKNVPTRTITAGGVEFAYRELGELRLDARAHGHRERLDRMRRVPA